MVGGKAQGQGYPLNQRRGGAADLGHIGLHRRPQARRPFGPEVGAMHQPAGAHAGIVRVQFVAEIDPLLLVGDARGQFAAEGKPAPPGLARPRHGDLGLFDLGQGEKGPRLRLQP